MTTNKTKETTVINIDYRFSKFGITKGLILTLSIIYLITIGIYQYLSYKQGISSGLGFVTVLTVGLATINTIFYSVFYFKHKEFLKLKEEHWDNLKSEDIEEIRVGKKDENGNIVTKKTYKKEDKPIEIVK